MVNGTAVVPANQVDEIKVILAELRATMDAMSKENEELLALAKYYGYQDWRTLALLDRGAEARKKYEKFMGRHGNGIKKG